MSGVAPEAIALSLLLGVLLGLVFAAVEALRVLLSLGRIATAALDLLFALLAAVSTFILALAVAKGSLRFFQAACEIIGFLCVELSQRLCRWLIRVGIFFLRKKHPSKAESEKKRGFFGNKAKKNEKKT